MTSTYDTCLQASRDHVDTRTSEQIAWDKQAAKVEDLRTSLVRLTRVRWKGETAEAADCIAVVRDVVDDLARELRALHCLGKRPGSERQPITVPERIEAVPVASPTAREG